MDLDKWILGRVEQVMINVLLLLDQPKDLAFEVMANVITRSSGLLYLIGTYDLFNGVEFKVTAEDEALAIALRLEEVAPEALLEELDWAADNEVEEWCVYFFHMIGGILSAKDGKGGITTQGTAILQESNEDDDEEDEREVV